VRVDPFALIIVSLLGALVIWLLVLGRCYPGSGADVVDWRPTRSVDVEVELELRDVAEMLEAQNRRRRARGQAELTEEGMEQRVAADRREMAARRDEYLADQDLEGLLTATNLRRRKRGLRDLTVEQLTAELADRAPAERPAGASSAPGSPSGG